MIINGAEATVGDVDRIRAKTDFPNFEIIADPKEATGEYLVFLDSDLEPFDRNWLTAMAEQLSNPKIGVVGARIISADDLIETAGLVLLPDGTVRSAFAGCTLMSTASAETTMSRKSVGRSPAGIVDRYAASAARTMPTSRIARPFTVRCTRRDDIPTSAGRSASPLTWIVPLTSSTGTKRDA